MTSYPTPAGAAGEERMNPGFVKLHPGAPVHVFTDCRDEEYHTRPFSFTTHIIAGGYREQILVRQPDGTYRAELYTRHPGSSHDMPVGVAHRLVGLLDGPCVTRCEYGLTTQTPGFIRLLPSGQLLHRYHYEPADTWQPWPRS